MILSLSNSKEHVMMDDDCYILVLKHSPNPNFNLNNFGSVFMWSRILKCNVMLSRILMGVPLFDGKEVDHINGNKLDNRLINLRWVTRTQNELNKPKKEGLSSKYRNVCWYKRKQRWLVSVRIKGKKKFGGLFKNEIEAALRADDIMILEHGEFARLNFPLYGA